MKVRLQIPSVVFFGLTAIMLAIIVVCFIEALTWINKPFPGFLAYYPPYVGSMHSRDWSGYKAGLRRRDPILTVNNQPVRYGQDIVNLARQKEPGTQIRYQIKQEDREREVTLPVGTFRLKDFFVVFSLPYLFGVLIFSLGFIVYLLKPNTSSSWVFFAVCFTVGGFCITAFEIQSSYNLVRFHYAMLSIFPATFFHLGLIFPDRKRVLTRFPALEYLMYLPAVLLILGWQIYFFVFPKLMHSESPYARIMSYEFLGPMLRIFALFCAVSLFALVLHSTFKSESSLARQRARMILFGVTIAFIPSGILMFLAAVVKTRFPWNFLPFFAIFFPAAIAYSIVRHNLFDADAIIKRTVGYVVVTAIVIGAYGLVTVSFNVFMDKYQVAQSRAFPILFTLGVILVFNPLRNRIQSLVDRLFFRKEYDYGEIVEKVGGAMTSLLDLGKILNRLTQTFIEDMFIDTGSVMLLTPDGTQFQITLADGERKQDVEQLVLKRDDPLMQIMEAQKRELTKYDILEDPQYKEVSESCALNFEALRASVMVPLVFQDKVIGSLNLGEKKSGKSYNREDIELLRTLASQGAVAIENARLFQENLEKQRMEEELNIARDLQMSMLPATCPEIEGFKIAAISTPAKEVGGDFYDFIEMGEGKLGLVVGDVTGKSVSGALVMSSSRSVFRMLSEEQLRVGDIMIRANRRIKKDVTSGMFVALLYAVLDGKERRVSLCSAGQTQPIHISAETGEATLVQTEGDTFPLGILEEADYKETRIQMASGDKVILYTDGIVEAMNEKDEIFGFERLLEVVKDAKSLDADGLLREIIGNVNGFVGSAAQHDDLTVIVVSAGEEGMEDRTGF